MSLINLIAQSIYKENISWLRRISKDNVLDDFDKKVVDDILSYYARYQDVPSFTWISSKHPYFWITTPAESNEKISSIYDDYLKNSIDRKLMLQTAALSAIYENDGIVDKNILSEIRKLDYDVLGNNDYESLSDFDFSSFERSGGLDYNIGSLNEVTAGLKNGELLVIAGRPKSTKTTLALWMAYNWYLYENKNIFIVSKEMRPIDLFAKLNSFIAGVNPLFFRKMSGLTETQKWNNPDFLKLKVAENLVKSNTFGSIMSPKKNIQTTEDLADTLNNLEHKPDVVIVDGFYLMGNQKSSTWERVSEISRGLKQVAGICDVPIIGVTQANRMGKGKDISQENIGYSDSIAQDADFAFGVYEKEDSDLTLNGISVKMLKMLNNRFGPSNYEAEFQVNFNNMSLKFNNVT